MTKRLEPYRVEAFNTAKQSENKMHDDLCRPEIRFQRRIGCLASTCWPI